MDYQIISQAEIQNLPDDPEQAFIQAEAICRRTATRRIIDANDESAKNAIRRRYIDIVSGLAADYEIPDLNPPDLNNVRVGGSVEEAYCDFS